MPYKKVEPVDQLKPFVESIWIQENSADAYSYDFPPTLILPVPKIDFIFHYLDPFVEIENEEKQLLPRFFLCGHRTKPVEVAATGKTGIIIVSMFPWSASAFVPQPVCEFTDKSIALDSIYGNILISELEDRLIVANNCKERVMIIERFLLGILKRRKGEKLVQHAVCELNNRCGNHSIQMLADDYNISRRQLDRHFLNLTGLNLKELSNLIRYQKALYLNKAGVDFGEIVFRLGYYDQSHFIKEMKRYTGKSPLQINAVQSTTNLTAYFNKKYLSHFYNTIYL